MGDSDIDIKNISNTPAPGISYFTPYQNPPAGQAANPQSNGSAPPKLFQPLKIRGLTLHNRIGLAPLCQYSSPDGHLTDWHMAHLGSIAIHGAGFVMVEATSVLPEGRITPEDSGLWKDSQIEPLRRVVEFVHSQSQVIGIQLGHAGRKASTFAPWLSSGDLAPENVGGWPDNIKGPSDIPWGPRVGKPKAMTKADIEEFKEAFGASVRRAVTAGVDFIEIHNAHGYLLSSFLSPTSNNRTDEYGGSFENRMRLTNEIVDISRKNMPEDMPLFLRVSSTEWLEESRPDLPSWTVEDTVRFAEVLAEGGKVDFIDISSGGNHPDQKVRGALPGVPYHAPMAKAVKKAVGDRMLVGVVGNITTGTTANRLLEEDGLDYALVGRWFQKHPSLVWSFAEELGVDHKVANQMSWPFGGRGSTTYLKAAQKN
ncbi:NADPH dehydrogenase [Trichophyton mentagrophytes]|uniref:OYEYqiMFMN n=1 Tax=Trichophyton interdigitale TaxID=101480 RepID=A0A9P5D0V0_9EURO|nr:OYEYqiMFMN [Trichophyton interdigitale]KAF3899440.1 OYEYqiMFMN [Trichophyton interdigitale]KAG8210869.1 OYEYqiMFMN [Trichophyton interdigitale]GBF62067.1 NADPH dehydrogenase [Trichophyton mentagrophytes]